MAFEQIRSAGLKPGKTVPLILNMLPGEPVIHVEHLGDENTGFLNDAIAKANAKAALGTKGQKLSRAKLDEMREKNRATLAKHSVRSLEAKHSDGRAATDKDIPEFVDALPADVVDIVVQFVNDAENFRDRMESKPEDLAEK